MTEPVSAYVFHATYKSNHDGDTVKLVLDHGSYPASKTLTEAELRIRNLRCPEIGEPGGEDAQAYVETLLSKAGRITVQTFKTATGAQGSFARTIADVWIDGELLANLVVKSGHGEFGKGVGV